MKYLKYFLYVILGLLVIFLAFGLFNPSIHYGHEILVDKSIKEAWAVTQDESKYGDWLKGFKSIELISGKDKAVGSKYKVVVNPGEGQPDFEMIQTVAEVQEFDHAKLLFSSDFMDMEQTISYKEKDGKTSVSTNSSVKGKGIMSRSMFALMEIIAGSFTAQETENMEALKKLIEENTTDYYPAPIETSIDVEESDEG